MFACLSVDFEKWKKLYNNSTLAVGPMLIPNPTPALTLKWCLKWSDTSYFEKDFMGYPP